MDRHFHWRQHITAQRVLRKGNAKPAVHQLHTRESERDIPAEDLECHYCLHHPWSCPLARHSCWCVSKWTATTSCHLRQRRKGGVSHIYTGVVWASQSKFSVMSVTYLLTGCVATETIFLEPLPTLRHNLDAIVPVLQREVPHLSAMHPYTPHDITAVTHRMTHDTTWHYTTIHDIPDTTWHQAYTIACPADVLFCYRHLPILPFGKESCADS